MIGVWDQTGCATGPHLHWSVIVNNACVDPMLFITPDTQARVEKSEGVSVGAYFASRLRSACPASG